MAVTQVLAADNIFLAVVLLFGLLVLSVVICLKMLKKIDLLNLEIKHASKRNTYASMVSHEIKNMALNVTLKADLIRNAIPEECVSNSKNAEELLGEIDRLYADAKALGNFVYEFVEMARSTSLSNIPKVAKKFNIDNAVRDASRIFVSTALKRGVSILVNRFDEDRPCKLVSADVIRVKQVLLNIVSNAVKYSKQDGEVKVTYGIRGSDFVVTVVDDGIGIPAKTLSDIRKAKSYIRGANTSRIDGTGIGLLVVNTFLVDINGSMVIDSKEDEGTTVTITVPVEVLEE